MSLAKELASLFDPTRGSGMLYVYAQFALGRYFTSLKRAGLPFCVLDFDPEQADVQIPIVAEGLDEDIYGDEDGEGHVSSLRRAIDSEEESEQYKVRTLWRRHYMPRTHSFMFVT